MTIIIQEKNSWLSYLRRKTHPNQKQRKEQKMQIQTSVANGKKMECQSGLRPGRVRFETTQPNILQF